MRIGRLYSYDTETHLRQPGLAAPPMVCASVARIDQGSERIVSKKVGLRIFRQLLKNPKITIGGASLDYDMGVAAAADPALVDLIFQALEDGRMVSTDVLEKLHSNAIGMLSEFGGNSLADLENRYLGVDRSAEKEDGWRKSYALLEHLPISEWPDDAVQYPRRDARGTLDVLLRQLGLAGALQHAWGTVPVPNAKPTDFLQEKDVCTLCGVEISFGPSGECPKGKPAQRFNLQCVVQEMRATWFLRLASIWGMRTDPLMVPGVVGEIRRKHEESRRLYFDAGIVRVRPCNKKDGEYERSDDIPLEWLVEAQARIAGVQAEWVQRRIADLGSCIKALSVGRPIRFAEDKGWLKHLVTVAYKGDPPMTAGGEKRPPDVSTARDTLSEADDQLLEEYGDAGPNEKLFSTYVNVLEQGTRIPICPGYNSTLSTQRTSYYEPNLQQLPRRGKVRECFVPRRGWIYNSVDYSSVEFSTLAQCCINLGIKQRTMADAINNKQDLHSRLAARFAGITYEQGMALKDAKDLAFLDLRQSAKPVGFGKAGLMGPPKIVYTARKDGVYLCEGAGQSKKGECRKHPRVTEYGRGRSCRKIPPTCEACLRLAAEYSELWYQEFPEMNDYHEITIAAAKAGEHGEPLDSFGTGMLRLESSANAASNHFFQNLAAQGAKHASWLLAKESYTDRKSVLFNNCRTVVFVHDETLTEIREPVLHEAAYRQAEIMVAGMKEFVPDVLIQAEPAAMRRWFKGAEKTFDRGGKLKPWWPRDWKFEADQAQMSLDRAA